MIDEARHEGSAVHFATLIDFCHHQKSELDKRFRKVQRTCCEGRSRCYVVLGHKKREEGSRCYVGPIFEKLRLKLGNCGNVTFHDEKFKTGRST